MTQKLFITLALLFLLTEVKAQENLNRYKYILVPKTFSLSKSDDQYQLNSITKFLFNKHGYEAYFSDDDLPEDLRANRCLALMADVSNAKNSTFKRKVEIILSDCYGATVMVSKIGESRLKSYDRAYSEALREAFKTFEMFNYNYSPVPKTVVVTALPQPKANKDVADGTQTATGMGETVTSSQALKSDKTPTEAMAKNESNSLDFKQLFYAQKIESGYQLVNSEPKVILILLHTAAKNVFIVKDQNAIVFKEDGFWYYSQNDGELKEQQKLNIKF